MGFELELIANISAWFLMSYFGRRSMILTGICLNMALLLSVGIAGCFENKHALLTIGVTVDLANLFYAPTIGATTWAVSAEVSSPRLRQKTQSLCTAVNALSQWLFAFITPYLINTDEADLGGKAAFVWAGLCIVGLIWAWFELPEIKGRKFIELDELFARKTPTRKFKSTIVDIEETHEDVVKN